MADAGEVTVHVRVLDGTVDVERYVPIAEHEALRAQLRDALADAERWEDMYWDLLSEHGGTR